VTVLLDTGVLFAGAVEADAHHARATELLRGLQGQTTITTDHVLVETWWLIVSRRDWESAMRFWRAFRSTPTRLEVVTVADLERAEAIATDWSDQQLDIVDCTTFAVMERVGCRRAASFDKDFAVYRFGTDRKQAFEIVR
jgi:hypothetical protein